MVLSSRIVALRILLLLSLVCHVFGFSVRYTSGSECSPVCEDILVVEDVPPLISSAFYFLLTPYFLPEQTLITTAIISDAKDQLQIAPISIDSGMYVVQLKDMVSPITIRLVIPSNAMATLPMSTVRTGVVCLEQPSSGDKVCTYLSPVPLSIPFHASVSRGASAEYMLNMFFPFAVSPTSSVLINVGENNIFTLDATRVSCASSSVPAFPGVECPMETSTELTGHDEIFRYTTRFPLGSYSPYRVQVPSATYPIALMLPWSSVSPLQAVMDHIVKHAEVKAHPSDSALFLISPLTPTTPDPVYPPFPKTVDAADEEMCVEVGSCWHLLPTSPLSWTWEKGHPFDYGVFVRGLLGVEAEEVVRNIMRRGGGFLSTLSRASLASSSARHRDALVSASSQGTGSLATDGDISWDGVVSGTMLSVVVAAGLQGFRPDDEITLLFNFVIREFDMFIARYAMCLPQPPHSVVCTLSAHVPHDRNGVSALHLYSTAFARTPKVHVNITHTFPSAPVEASGVDGITLALSDDAATVVAASAGAAMAAAASMSHAGASMISPSLTDEVTASPVTPVPALVSTAVKTTAMTTASLSSTFKAFDSISLVSLPAVIDPVTESPLTSPFLQTGFVSPPIPSHTVLDNHFLLVEVGCLLDVPSLYANDAPCERISQRILRCPFNYHINHVVDVHPFSLALLSFTYHKSVAVRASPVFLRRVLHHDVSLELEKRAIAAHVTQPFDIAVNRVNVTLGAQNVTLNVDVGVVGDASRLFFPSVDRLVMNTTAPLFRSAFTSGVPSTGTFTPIISSDTVSAFPGSDANGATRLDDAASVEIECHAFSAYVLVCVLAADSLATQARFAVTVACTETTSALPLTTGLSVGIYTGTNVQECGGDLPLSPTDDDTTSTASAKDGGWVEYVTDSSALAAAAARTRGLASQARSAASVSALRLARVGPASTPSSAAAVLPASWVRSGVVTKDTVDMEYVGPVHEPPMDPENRLSTFPWPLLTPLWVAIAAGLCAGVYCCRRNCAVSAKVAPEDVESAPKQHQAKSMRDKQAKRAREKKVEGVGEPASHCIHVHGDHAGAEECVDELIARSRQYNNEDGAPEDSRSASITPPSPHWAVEMTQLPGRGRRASSDPSSFEDDRGDFTPSSSENVISSSLSSSSFSSEEDDEDGDDRHSDTTASESASEVRTYLQAYVTGIPVFARPPYALPLFSTVPFYGSTGQWTFGGAPQITESDFCSLRRPVWWVWPICQQERSMRKILPLRYQVGFFLLDRIIYNLPRYVLPKQRSVRRRAARARPRLPNRTLAFAVMCWVIRAARLLVVKVLSPQVARWKDNLASLGIDSTYFVERLVRTNLLHLLMARTNVARAHASASPAPTSPRTPASVLVSISSLSSHPPSSGADEHVDLFSHEYDAYNEDEDTIDRRHIFPFNSPAMHAYHARAVDSSDDGVEEYQLWDVYEQSHAESPEASNVDAGVDSAPSCGQVPHPVPNSRPHLCSVALPIAVSVFDPSDDLIILPTSRTEQAPPHALVRVPMTYTSADVPDLKLPLLPTQAPLGESYPHRVPVHDILHPALLPSQVHAEEYVQAVPPMFVTPPSPFAASHVQYDPAQPAELRVVNGMALRLKPEVSLMKLRRTTPVIRPIANAFDVCPGPPLPALHSQNSVAAIRAEDYSAIVAAPDLLPHPNVPEQRRLFTHVAPAVPAVDYSRCPSSSSLRADMQQALGYTPPQASHALAIACAPPPVPAPAARPHPGACNYTQCKGATSQASCSLTINSPYSIHHTQLQLRRHLQRMREEAEAKEKAQSPPGDDAAAPQSTSPSPKVTPEAPVPSALPSPLPRLHDGIRPQSALVAPVYEPIQTPYLAELPALQYTHAALLHPHPHPHPHPQYQHFGAEVHPPMPQAYAHAPTPTPMMFVSPQQHRPPVPVPRDMTVVAPAPAHQYLPQHDMSAAPVPRYMPESPAPQYLAQAPAPQAMLLASTPLVVYGVPAPQAIPQAPVFASAPPIMREAPLYASTPNVAVPPRQTLPEAPAGLYPSVPTAVVDQLSLLPPIPREGKAGHREREGRRRAHSFPPLLAKVAYIHPADRD